MTSWYLSPLNLFSNIHSLKSRARIPSLNSSIVKLFNPKLLSLYTSKAARYRHADDKEERRFNSLLTSALDGVSGQRHVSAALYSRERTRISHWIGGRVGLRAGLDTEARGKVLCFCAGSNPVCPVVQSVVRHYAG
jgi:hypothetical protein